MCGARVCGRCLQENLVGVQKHGRNDVLTISPEQLAFSHNDSSQTRTRKGGREGGGGVVRRMRKRAVLSAPHEGASTIMDESCYRSHAEQGARDCPTPLVSSITWHVPGPLLSTPPVRLDQISVEKVTAAVSRTASRTYFTSPFLIGRFSTAVAGFHALIGCLTELYPIVS